VQRYIGLIFVVVIAAVSCVSPGDTTSPTSLRQNGSVAHDEQLDCQLEPARCEKILNAIDYLIRIHPSPTCKGVGWDALDRYTAPSGVAGFKQDTIMPPGFFDMFVDPPSGYIWVTRDLWSGPFANDPQKIGGLVAHEIGGHLWGGESGAHESGLSMWYQSTCSSEM
jgi:hypothetical protein